MGKTKECGVCLKQKVIWKSKTRDRPQMCKQCFDSQPKETTPTEELDQAIGKGHFNNAPTILTVIRPKTKTGKIQLKFILQQAEKVFNAWIRKRDTLPDRTFICISCGKYKSNKEMDCGHFYPKTFAMTRFNEDNNHGECVQCNRMDSNHLIGYKLRLLEKIGLERMKKLKELHNKPFKWDRYELELLIEKYK